MVGALKALIALPIALLLILLAVANRAPVLLSLDPFAQGAPEIGLTVPLFAVILGSVAIGVVLGGVGSWMAGGKHRRARRRSARDVNRLEAETERLRAAVAAHRPTGLALPGPARSAPDGRVYP